MTALYDPDDYARDAESIAREYVDWQQAERARRQQAATELPRLRDAVRALYLAHELGWPEDPRIDELQRIFDEIGETDELIIRQMLLDVVRDGEAGAWAWAKSEAVRVRHDMSALDATAPEDMYAAVTGRLPRRTPGAHRAPEGDDRG